MFINQSQQSFHAGSGCLEDATKISNWEACLGTFSILASLSMGIPQIFKIFRLQSSKSLSFWTLAMGNLAGQFYIINMFLLHFSQISHGLTGSPLDWSETQRHLMMLYVVLANTFSYSLIYPTAFCFHHSAPVQVLGFSTTSSKLALWGLFAQIVVTLLGWSRVLKIVIEGHSCTHISRAYANLCGGLVSLFAILQFLPQVYVSWTAKGSFALSYFTLGGDMLAGSLAVLEKVGLGRTF
mmetsp:Transcript_16529/g.22840  ORF Transcript_16529/g.22840 Transcript_16529/m.22840 type:complete len:239 (+) Transcript_16529:98-814(+)